MSVLFARVSCMVSQMNGVGITAVLVRSKSGPYVEDVMETLRVAHAGYQLCIIVRNLAAT